MAEAGPELPQSHFGLRILICALDAMTGPSAPWLAIPLGPYSFAVILAPSPFGMADNLLGLVGTNPTRNTDHGEPIIVLTVFRNGGYPPPVLELSYPFQHGLQHKCN